MELYKYCIAEMNHSTTMAWRSYVILMVLIPGSLGQISNYRKANDVCQAVGCRRASLGAAKSSSLLNGGKKPLDLQMGAAAEEASRILKEMVEEATKQSEYDAEENVKNSLVKTEKKLDAIKAEVKKGEKHVKRQLKQIPLDDSSEEESNEDDSSEESGEEKHSGEEDGEVEHSGEVDSEVGPLGEVDSEGKESSEFTGAEEGAIEEVEEPEQNEEVENENLETEEVELVGRPERLAEVPETELIDENTSAEEDSEDGGIQKREVPVVGGGDVQPPKSMYRLGLFRVWPMKR